MPRPPRREVKPATPNSLIASAAVLTNNRMVRPKKNGATEWQKDAWYYYDSIGEFRFACDWRAAACSRARLTIVEDTPEGDETITEGPEVEALGMLFGGDSGQGQMLGTVALHFDVPGETYIVGEVVPDEYVEGAEVDRWAIYSNEELSRDSGGDWMVDRGDGKRALADDALVIRLWRSHPRKWVEATSPARAVLPVLREIEGIGKHIGATIDSRLAGNGLLLVPSEMQFTPPPGVNGEADPMASHAVNLLNTLTAAMLASIKDRDSASAVAPVVATAPGALLEHVKHVTFSTPFDERTQTLQEKDLRRLALGMDMPPEVLLGLGDSNHWSAWQIDESALKTAIEPLLETITAGLTERWLYPAVEALVGKQGVNTRRRIGFDTTDLRLRPDRSAEATAAHQDLLLSDEARLRETGFDAGDLIQEDELRRRLLIRLALNVTDPAVSLAALRQLGVAGMPDAPTTTIPALESAPPAEVEPPVENVREIPDAAAAGVLAAATALVHRAVERANNKVSNRAKGARRPIPPDRLDDALAGAWDHAPQIASMLRVDPDRFVDGLDRYTRALLTEGVEHRPAVLQQVLAVGAGRG